MASLMLATKEPFIQTILNVAVPKMVFGHTLLTEDAAFVPRPHTAASTSKAASKAIDLITALKDADDLATSLHRREREQLQLGRFLKWQGQRLGNASQFPERMA
jgi:2-polyprenyl-6-methoxyphenol hydroxylase-like FAD-dependent oxidoreductase